MDEKDEGKIGAQLIVKVPFGVRQKLEVQANNNKRSLTKEIAQVLEDSV